MLWLGQALWLGIRLGFEVVLRLTYTQEQEQLLRNIQELGQLMGQDTKPTLGQRMEQGLVVMTEQDLALSLGLVTVLGLVLVLGLWKRR